MTLGKRIKQLRKTNGMTQEELGKKIGVVKSTISLYESGGSNPDDIIKSKIADLFGVSIDYLLGRTDVIDSKDHNFFSPKPVRINVYGSIPAGIPLEAVEDITDWEEIPEDWTAGGKQYIALRVSGDSMYPEYLDGDVVIILLQPDCENGDDCAVYINGYDVTLKRIKKEPGKITLQPLNTNYSPQTYKHPGEVEILGVVKELRRKK